MYALIGAKKSQSQRFLENGMRIPVTLIDVKGNCIIAVKTLDRDHYQAVQLGFSMKKKASRAQLGHAKGAKLEKAPKFLREVRIYDDSPLPEIGSIINPSEVFQPGDIVNVSGLSKGKGFAGVVKRHGFHGGPKTHGQSDRHRAPGAIGQGTTPGRVYRGKRMAGRMGNENVTIRNLEIMDITADGVLVIKGLVPGIINGLIVVKKVGEDKKFVPLYKEASDVPEVSKVSEGDDQSSEDEALRSSSENSENSESQNVSESENQKPAITEAQNETETQKEDKEESADAKALADKEDAK